METGRQGDESVSLIADDLGIYFETNKPNRLHELIMAVGDLNEVERAKAEAGLAILQKHQLSKYNDYPLECPPLPDRFVVVVDQTFGDASVLGSGADAGTFQAMLDTALAENPDATVLIKAHPETLAGKRLGYFEARDTGGRVAFFDSPISPWILFSKAQAVYCVSSQIGLEAIFAGVRPVVFGDAFYAGWGLSDDRHPRCVSKGARSAVQLFHAAYLKYCRWYDPILGVETEFEAAAHFIALGADIRRSGKQVMVLHKMRLWKRGFLRDYLAGRAGAPRFVESPIKAIETAVQLQGPIGIWAGKETPEFAANCLANSIRLLRVEDGFVRSGGLGAALVKPASLAFDDLGIYYDPTRESRLEKYILAAQDLPKEALDRAEALAKRIVDAGVSKYNLGGQLVDMKTKPGQQLVLIPGQVEDDASILKGGGDVRTNLDLVRAARLEFPDAYLIYKPHPDVEEGLRDGGKMLRDISLICDLVVEKGDIAALLSRVDAVATITSLTGFEALLRGKKVVCFGVPFYAGWGLTIDRSATPERRTGRPSLAGLIHATLIDYPRYWDPVSGRPCLPEAVVARFEQREFGRGSGRHIRILAKIQGALASFSYFWR